MCYKTAVLDWNGTLLNDLPFSYQSVRHIFKAFGLPAPTLEQYRKDVSYEWMKFYIKYGIPEDVDPEKLNSIRRKFFEEQWDNVSLQPYVVEFLEFLKKKHIRIFLLTGEVGDVVLRRLKQFSLEHFFDGKVVSTRNKVEVLRCLYFIPSETIYIDDDSYALSGVKELGFTTVGMTHGYGLTEQIRHAKPHLMSNHFSGVMGFIDSH